MGSKVSQIGSRIKLQEAIIPKCIKQIDCHSVCSSLNCKIMPFMCINKQCQCHLKHVGCSSNVEWKKIKEIFQNKLATTSDQYMQYFQEIEDIYKLTLKQIQKSFLNMQKNYSIIGLNQIERDIYNIIQQKRFRQLNGSLIHQLQSQFQIKYIIQIRSIEKQKQQIYRQTQRLTKMLQCLTKVNQLKGQYMKEKKEIKQQQNKSNLLAKNPIRLDLNFSSKITNELSLILSFFPKKVREINLLYRASENNFKTNMFWELCSNKPNTFVILRTQFGKIIGGYTPYVWSEKFQGNFTNDVNKQSFLFSLTEKHKIPLLKPTMAIYHNTIFGPRFGGGADLIIFDRAHQSNLNYTSIGHSFNNGEYIQGDQKSIKKFSGQQQGNKFLITQWQVHQIVFD